jgi:hypothetical protein
MHYLSRMFHLSWSPFFPNLILWKSMLLEFHFILILNISNSPSSIYNFWIGLSCHIMSCQKWYDECFSHNRVIHKVRKTQHQNPEFGHTQGELQKKPAKKYISSRRGMKLRKPSILVVN